jgi:hypothetical protein
VATRAQFLAEVLLRNELTEADFSHPVAGKRRAALDELLQRAVHSEGVVRIDLFAPSGRITYSTSPRLIGTFPPGDKATARGSGRDGRAARRRRRRRPRPEPSRRTTRSRRARRARARPRPGRRRPR